MPKDDLLENLDLVFEKLNDGLLLLSLTGKILKINQTLLDIGGYKREELEGKNVMRLVKIFPPESLKKIVGSFADAIKGMPGDRYELGAKTKQGKLKIIEISNSVIKKQGKMIGIVVTARETTSRIDFEKKIKESEERHRTLYNSSQDAIMILESLTWKFISGNSATLRLFNIKSEDELKKMGPGDLSPKNQPDGSLSEPRAKAMIAKAMKEGSSSFEWVHKKITGQEFPATVLLTRMRIGKKLFLQATVRDISFEKLAKDKLNKKIEEVEKINRLMVGRELKMIELKEEVKQLKSGMAIVEKKKNWSQKFQDAIDLEEGVIRKYKTIYIDEVNKSNLSLLKKRKAKKLLNILIEESIGHEKHFKELIQRENGKR